MKPRSPQREFKDINTKEVDAEQNKEMHMQQQVRARLEKSQRRFAHPSQKHLEKEMHSMEASADKKLPASERTVLTGSYRQKEDKLPPQLHTTRSP